MRNDRETVSGREAHGWWDANRLVYREDREENGKKITHQEVFEDITPASFSQILSEGPDGGELKRIVTIRAAKVLQASMKSPEGSSDEAELRAAKAEIHEASSGGAPIIVGYCPQPPTQAAPV